jgi:hypothetical protein
VPYSFWKDNRGYESVSVNANLPGPVAGYLIPAESGWIIEGDDPQAIFASREQAAAILIDRYHKNPN